MPRTIPASFSFILLLLFLPRQLCQPSLPHRHPPFRLRFRRRRRRRRRRCRRHRLRPLFNRARLLRS